MPGARIERITLIRALSDDIGFFMIYTDLATLKRMVFI